MQVAERVNGRHKSKKYAATKWHEKLSTWRDDIMLSMLLYQFEAPLVEMSIYFARFIFSISAGFCF